QASALRERVRSIDPDAFLTDVRSMDQLIASSQAERRAATLVIGVFSGLALVLVVFGIVSVITQVVIQRQFEMAIRAALGAEAHRLVALSMRVALQPTVIGLGIGIAGAAIVTRLIRATLFGVASSDPISWLSAGSVLLVGCALAAYVPARRAARIDPMMAL